MIALPGWNWPGTLSSPCCAISFPCDTLNNCPGHLAGIRGISLREGASVPRIAGVAQSVEHLICNQRVGGSNPFASSREMKKRNFPANGGTVAAQQVFPTHSIRSFSPGVQ
jgi:hypothetical protein